MTAAIIPLSGSVRRRRTQGEPSRKATFQIRESVLQAVRDLVDAGTVPSQSVLVEQALEQKLRDLRREQLYAAYEEAAKDPVFMRELAEVTSAFDGTVGDGLATPVKVKP